MTALSFDLVTEWRFAAPVERVWAELQAVEAWPQWWPMVKGVQVLRRGDAQGLGSVRRLTWATALPYSLAFDIETVRVEPLALIEGRANGELDGVGVWTLAPDGEETQVRYDWRVAVTKPWMRAMVPMLRPVFAWNHGVVMERGRKGLAARLASSS
jgi:uncharacterized protein YndB with AHSA1/START domain